MNLDAAQALFLVILAFCVRDGLLAWYLIARVPHASPPVVPPVAPANTSPVGPPVPVVPVVPSPTQSGVQPRFTGITATSFGGPGDTNSSAYGGVVDPNSPGVALPYHFSGARPTVRAFNPDNGKTVDAAIVDVGPWNTDDPYWATGARPQAESGIDSTGRKTNLAGIDLTPAAWTALGVSSPNSAKQKISWDFVPPLPNVVVPAAPAPSPVGSTPPWLTLARSLVGKSAAANGSEIVAWSSAISAKYPDMASYCAQYNDPSIPWCGLFVAYVLAMNGIRPVFGSTDTQKFLWAAAWDTFGAAVATPQPGDIMRFSWSDGGEHVTLYDHEVDDDYYHCTGGNQGNHVVSTEAMPMGAIISIRRPPSP